MRVTNLTLPFPPSVNGLYDGGMRTKRRFKSARYKKWIKAADGHLIHQVALPSAHEYRHSGIVNIEYRFKRPDKRTRDLANYIKAVDDFLVENRIIKDDSLIHILTARWDDSIDDGALVTIVDSGSGAQ